MCICNYAPKVCKKFVFSIYISLKPNLFFRKTFVVIFLSDFEEIYIDFSRFDLHLLIYMYIKINFWPLIWKVKILLAQPLNIVLDLHYIFFARIKNKQAKKSYFGLLVCNLRNIWLENIKYDAKMLKKFLIYQSNSFQYGQELIFFQCF